MYRKALISDDGIRRWDPPGESWQRLGGIFANAPPAAVSMETERLDVFGLGADYAMHHKILHRFWWDPPGESWEKLGGTFTSAPAAVSWGPNGLDVFGLGTDYAMYHKAWVYGRWDPPGESWQRLGGIFTSAPAALKLDYYDIIGIFGLGLDNSMYYKTLIGSYGSRRRWDPPGESWQRLGGTFIHP
jgi:hypothetical protein